MTINNGDIYDIGQTVNGVSRFIYIGDKWHYFSKDITREYEYDQSELLKTIENINEYNDITFIGNIFKFYTKQDVINSVTRMYDIFMDDTLEAKKLRLKGISWHIQNTLESIKQPKKD